MKKQEITNENQTNETNERFLFLKLSGLVDLERLKSAPGLVERFEIGDSDCRAVKTADSDGGAYFLRVGSFDENEKGLRPLTGFDLRVFPYDRRASAYGINRFADQDLGPEVMADKELLNRIMLDWLSGETLDMNQYKKAA